MSRIYVASSWRNPYHAAHVALLRDVGHRVYDFRHPGPAAIPDVPDGDAGFGWRELAPDWERWTPAQFRAALAHPVARAAYAKDKAAMKWADTFVVVLPCGRSAHLEAGWAWGQGKRLIVSFPTIAWVERSNALPSFVHPLHVEPELMYAEAQIVVGPDELTAAIDGPPRDELTAAIDGPPRASARRQRAYTAPKQDALVALVAAHPGLTARDLARLRDGREPSAVMAQGAASLLHVARHAGRVRRVLQAKQARWYPPEGA